MPSSLRYHLYIDGVLMLQDVPRVQGLCGEYLVDDHGYPGSILRFFSGQAHKDLRVGEFRSFRREQLMSFHVTGRYGLIYEQEEFQGTLLYHHVDEEGRTLECAIVMYLDPCPSDIYDVFEIFANEPVDRPNRWAALSPQGRRSWLRYLPHRRDFSRDDKQDSGKSLTLDGRYITTYESFYIALGEMAHGPAGYYGQDADGMRDCLTGGLGEPRVPMTIVWKDHEVAKKHLGYPWAQRSNLLEVLDARNWPWWMDTTEPCVTQLSWFETSQHEEQGSTVFASLLGFMRRAGATVVLA